MTTNSSYHKAVIMNRAVPGSGKTTISHCIVQALQEAGLQVTTHSTDDFFMVGNRYCFEPARLGEYHQENLRLFQEDLEAGVDVVICDNTNLLPWQTAPYTDLARTYGYRILFLNFLPRDLELHVRSQQVTEAKPDAHQVPRERLREFIRDFHVYNGLLNRACTVNGAVQRDYTWDEAICDAQETGRATCHFEADAVMTIAPEDYHAIQGTIGEQVLAKISSWRHL